MANNLKTYAVLTIMVLGLVFMGIGCTGTENSEGSSPVQEISSEGTPERNLQPKHRVFF